MRECGVAHPAVRPYISLATAVQAHAGDQATLAVLLAAAVVRAGHERPAHMLDAIPWARKQTRALLAAHARDGPPGRALEAVAAGWGGPILEGLASMGSHIDLARIDIRAEDCAAPCWAKGTLIPERHPRPHGRILVCDTLLRLSLEGAVARDPAGLRAYEDAQRQAAVAHAKALGVGVVVCHGSGELAEDLRSHGILVHTDASKGLMQRLEETGAVRVPRLTDALLRDLGKAAFSRHDKGWLAASRSWTLLVPSVGPAKESSIDTAEKILRAAGAVLEDPRCLPGGGRWQRIVADGLRRSADHAPGKAPLGIRAIADAFDGLADTLVRNMGKDPFDVKHLGEIHDAAACAELAVEAAFEAATQILRLDARYTRAPSSPEKLRGGTGPIGSPKGMPGDIPPLM